MLTVSESESSPPAPPPVWSQGSIRWKPWSHAFFMSGFLADAPSDLVKSRVAQELGSLVETSYPCLSWFATCLDIFKSAPWCIWSSSFQVKAIDINQTCGDPGRTRWLRTASDSRMIPHLQLPPSNHQADGISVSHHHSLEGRCVCLSEIKCPKSARESFPKYSKPQGGSGTIKPWNLETSTRHSSYGRSQRCKIKHLFWVDPMFIQVFKTPPVYYRLLLS